MNVRIIKGQILAIIIIVSVLISCDSKQREKVEEKKAELTFKSYYDTLKTIDTPVTLDWTIWNKESGEHINKYGPVKSNDLLENPFGKIFDLKNFKGIIFIASDEGGSPTLVTIDNNDSPIDTLFLLGDNYSNDANWLTIEQAKINSDQTIVLLDSVFHWDLNNDGDRIPKTKRINVEREKYNIDESGKIEKTE